MNPCAVIGTPPSDLHAHLGYWLRMVSNAVSQSFARKVEAEGVTVAEWVVLRMLYDVERVSPSELSERMGMTKGAISKLADRLIAKSLVERGANEEDKRAQWLRLNNAGRTLVPRLAALADKNDAEFFGALSAEERLGLEQLLQKIVVDRGMASAPID
jgi:MarR family transcriptional regulator, lower aerobic nicotinate degradation pathway regulator